jgi:hypothetical protein
MLEQVGSVHTALRACEVEAPVDPLELAAVGIRETVDTLVDVESQHGEEGVGAARGLVSEY